MSPELFVAAAPNVFLRLLFSLNKKRQSTCRLWVQRRIEPRKRRSPVNLVEQWFGCGVSPSVPPWECAPGWLAGADGCSASFFFFSFFLYFGEFYPAVTAPPRFRPCIARLIPFPYKECERQRAAKPSENDNTVNSAACRAFNDAHMEALGTATSFLRVFNAPELRSYTQWNPFELVRHVGSTNEERKEALALGLRNSSGASTVINYELWIDCIARLNTRKPVRVLGFCVYLCMKHLQRCYLIILATVAFG